MGNITAFLRGQVVVGLSTLGIPDNAALWHRNLAVGPGTNTQVVTEVPVIEVVPAGGTVPAVG